MREKDEAHLYKGFFQLFFSFNPQSHKAPWNFSSELGQNWCSSFSHLWPHHPHSLLPLCSPHSLFLILPFFWPPRPNPEFLTSLSNCLFLERSVFRPPLCRNWCFCFFLRCFRICSLVFSSEWTTRPPGVCCCLAGLWKLGPRRPRPRPDGQMT